jgi:hypothetical protein
VFLVLESAHLCIYFFFGRRRQDLISLVLFNHVLLNLGELSAAAG